MNKLLTCYALFCLAACTKEPPLATAAAPRCVECATAVVSTKAGCPTVSDTKVYDLCGEDAAAWEQRNTYVWVTNGTTHTVVTTCNIKGGAL